MAKSPGCLAAHTAAGNQAGNISWIREKLTEYSPADYFNDWNFPFEFSHGAVNDRESFRFPAPSDGRLGDNQWVDILGTGSSLKLLAFGHENDFGPRSVFNTGDDSLPAVDVTLGPQELTAGDREIHTTATGGGFSYTLQWHIHVATFTEFI